MIIVLQSFIRNDKMSKNMEFGMLEFVDAA